MRVQYNGLELNSTGCIQQFFNNERCLKFNLSATDKKSEILDLMKSLCIESQIS